MKQVFEKGTCGASSISLLLLLFAGITQISGTPNSIRIVPASKAALQTTINANFPFETPLEVEALDASGARIKTGSDSTLTITAKLSDATKCLADKDFKLVQGVGTFVGSVCEVLSNKIKISFATGALTSDDTPELTVTGNIYVSTILKQYRNFAAEQARWMELYLEMYNDGVLAPTFTKAMPDRTFLMKNYYHYGTKHGAFRAYSEMKAHEKAHPEQKSHTVIGTSDTELTRLLLPMMTQDKYSMLSVYKDSDIEFSNKTLFPYYNRFSASVAYEYQAIGIFLRERKWNKVTIIYDEGSTPLPEMSTQFQALGVEIIREFSIMNSQFPGDVDPNWKSNTVFDYIFNDIKQTDSQIILMFGHGNAATTLYGSAMRNNVTSTDYYQWVFIGEEPKNGFPQDNNPAICHAYGEFANGRTDNAGWLEHTWVQSVADTWCSYRFFGALFLTEHGQYQDGGVNQEWVLALLQYKNAPPKDFYGGLSFQFEKEGDSRRSSLTTAAVAKSWDAAKINVAVIKDLIDAQKTITGDAIANGIRVKSISGLSGENIKFDVNGDALNYAMDVAILYPRWDIKFDMARGYTAFRGTFTYGGNAKGGHFYGAHTWDYFPIITSRVIFYKGITATESEKELASYEITKGLFQDYYPTHKTERGNTYLAEINAAQNPVAKKYQTKRSYITVRDAFYSKLDQTVRQNDWRYWKSAPPLAPNNPTQLEEYVISQYFCVDGCGGIQDSNDVNDFANGNCISINKCLCKKEQSGTFLWSGLTCATPICKAGCLHGTCASPNNCVCSPGYSGTDCKKPICDDCDGIGGDCVKPNDCKCKNDFYGVNCRAKCSCGKGTCNDGSQGDGMCTCESGYMGDDCGTNWHMILIIVIVLVIVGALLVALLIKWSLKRNQRRSALKNNDWIVKWTDMKRHDEITGKSSLFLSGISMNQTRANKTVNTGTWNGIDVHYQRLEKDSVPASLEVRYEVLRMLELRHEHIVAFVGVCLDAPNVSILTEITPKGSLEDLLSNEDIRIPWDFRYPILKGICLGLQKIHGSFMECHGRLKSSNVLIDGRWTPKITGFGLLELKKDQKNVGKFNHDNPRSNTVDREKSNYGSLLWTAPELLLNGYYHIDHVGAGTKENDIYSFGMILVEVATRDQPFADLMIEKEDIIQLIKGQKNDAALKIWNDYVAKMNLEAGGLIRPCIKDDHWPKKFEQRKALAKFMENCWNQDPDQRPSIDDCLAEIARMDPQATEIMDRLVKMLEKYSTNLEDVVTKRTKQLAKEKKKTEDLVSRLLPKTISEDLKQGKRVEPENFDAVTIFFSDIVGFTNIARASTPMQVVTLLNDMYTSFDSISANYDCYKVETIGDAYMIVSGLPTRNGDKHAGEIATCAMDLICSIGGFKIRHMPDTIMQLRVGLHTGSCVAGVVGLKMPRYCLFGDTVQIAEKMESGGGAMRIHCSEDTHSVLERLGGYNMEYRGEVEVKNRGTVKTYWINGKDGYSKELPVPPPL